jgi:hypothetical protein
MGMLLVLCGPAVTILAGCTPPPEQRKAVAPTRKVETGLLPFKDLQLTLPKGWKAAYDGVSRWRVEKNGPPDHPVVTIWSLSSNQEPKNLVDFSHRLQTSTELTEGTYVLDRATEQGNFSDGYYVVGKFHPRKDRSAKSIGFAMIRDLGGQKRIFECCKINDPAQREEALELCKSAKF